MIKVTVCDLPLIFLDKMTAKESALLKTSLGNSLNYTIIYRRTVRCLYCRLICMNGGCNAIGLTIHFSNIHNGDK